MWEKASFLFLLMAILYFAFGIAIWIIGSLKNKRGLYYLSFGFLARTLFYILPGLLLFDVNITWGVWIVGPLKVSLLPFPFLFFQKLGLKSKQLKRNDLWHFLPLLFCLIITIVVIMGQPSNTDFNKMVTTRDTMQIIWQGSVIFNSIFIPAKVVCFLQFIVYSVLYTSLFTKYTKTIDKQNLNNKSRMKWIKATVILMIIYSFSEGIGVFGVFSHTIPFILLVIFHVIFVFYFFILTMVRYNTLELLGETVNGEISSVNKKVMKTESQLIIEKFNEEKLYLLTDISLSKVALQLGIPQYRLTQIVKDEGYPNFYSFINYYRIERSKELLSEMPNNYVIEAIIKDSGFNSRSTFFRVFKEVTGETPLQYFNNKK